ncbi:hypothetical protein OIDMADRAFT_40820 [Oidiodendron maius Zn]|uniref:Major facilitator superfamily (MFS) profile domain-containing protein n=1 Tax=Oidiodendron maius (strain Zn) TaxID=913774 RepID=A0A0C3HLM0_OIDMZ|nr:hypothetical protein OIDMADRAFT_40820 [Oidiodendron maius Zn]
MSEKDTRGAAEQEIICPAHTTERRLIWRIDLHVMPFLCIMYLMSFLDKVNIGNARSFNLETDLHLESTQFNTALTIFFVPYVLFEIPSNVILKRWGPQRWVPLCMFLFGLVMMCQGFVQSYSGLLAARFFLGLCEAGMFPGSFYMMAMWYKRWESQKRFTLFFGSTTLAGAFGGLLAAAIGKMSGDRGYHGWRWIFILEGVATMLFAIVFAFTYPTFIGEASWLRDDERAFLVARLKAEQGDSAADRPITTRDVIEVMKDPKVWLGSFMCLGVATCGYSYAYFSPTIIATYGYSAIKTQLVSVPPWACAFVWSMLWAFISDWIKNRFFITIGSMLITIVGLALLLNIHNDHHAEYGFLFLFTMGIYTAMPMVFCWYSMNLSGHHRRSIGTGFFISFANIGAIISTYAFLSADAPDYHPGYSICLGFMCLAILSACLYAGALYLENRKRDRATVDITLTESEKVNLGDLNPDLRYML